MRETTSSGSRTQDDSFGRVLLDVAFSVASCVQSCQVPSKPNKSPKAHAAFFTGLGQRLKTMREDRGWRQEDMLSHGFSVRHWQRIEAGKSITVSTLLRIADAFAQPPETIIAGFYGHRRTNQALPHRPS